MLAGTQHPVPRLHRVLGGRRIERKPALGSSLAGCLGEGLARRDMTLYGIEQGGDIRYVSAGIERGAWEFGVLPRRQAVQHCQTRVEGRAEVRVGLAIDGHGEHSLRGVDLGSGTRTATRHCRECTNGI